MGCYLSPCDGSSKEMWLLEHGSVVGHIREGSVQVPRWVTFQTGYLPVVLIDCGLFKAAAVCYCEAEYADLTSTYGDVQVREIYSVPVAALRGASDIADYL